MLCLASLQALKPYMTHITSCRNITSIEYTSTSVPSGFQTRETFETTRPQAEKFFCSRAFGSLMRHEARVLEITSPTKKISLNYHLNIIWGISICRYGGGLCVLALRFALRLAKSYDAKCQNGYTGRDKRASKRRNWTY